VEQTQLAIKELNMRSFFMVLSAVVAFAATMIVEKRDANAVVCNAGVGADRDRSGCAKTRDQLSGLLAKLEAGLQADVTWRATNAFLRDASCLA
jgi:hypothetical protein